VAPYLILALFLLGVWGLVRKDNMIKKVIALSLVNSSLIVAFVYLGSLSGSTAPILLRGVKDVVDPLPQALMLTAIVIGICLTALALVLVARIHRHYGTLNIRRIEQQLLADQAADDDQPSGDGGRPTGPAGSGDGGGASPGPPAKHPGERHQP
jgi:multicomponent Na+:H+ antiporter subunit C